MNNQQRQALVTRFEKMLPNMPAHLLSPRGQLLHPQEYDRRAWVDAYVEKKVEEYINKHVLPKITGKSLKLNLSKCSSRYEETTVTFEYQLPKARIKKYKQEAREVVEELYQESIRYLKAKEEMVEQFKLELMFAKSDLDDLTKRMQELADSFTY